MTRLRDTAIYMLTLLVVVLAPHVAFGAEPTLTAAARATFEDVATGAGALKKLGYRAGDILVAERLPDGSYAVEIAFESDENRGRFPMRIRQTDAGWETSWAPDAAFGTALGNVLASGALPESQSDRAWTSARRLPAFPVIVTKARVITPFGAIEPADPAAGSEPTLQRPSGGRPQQTGPIPTSQELARHTRQWINRALGDDPAPASFDLIIDASISWERLNAAIFSLASAGLYLGEIVAQGNGWVSVPFAVPVSAATGNTPPGLILAYQPTDDGYGFRVVRNGELAETAAECDAPLAICGSEPATFPAALKALTGGEDVARVMFASGPSANAGQAIGLIDTTINTLGLAPHRLFIGFISP